jgi:uncharacterized SAM-binding protein YcdF (DUF218 family)
LANTALSWLETDPVNKLETAEVGIVLTGIVESGITVPNQVQLSEGADRLIEAIRLLKQGRINQILISGGAADIHNPEQNEGFELYQLAVSLGVKPDQLIHENKSRNTYENAKYCKSLLLNTKQAPVLITSAYHMKRASACFKKQGIEVVQYPVDFRTISEFQWDMLIPSADAFRDWNIISKELTGIVVYRLMGYV